MVFLLYLYFVPRFWYRRVVSILLFMWAGALAVPTFFTEVELQDNSFFRLFVQGGGWEVHLPLCLAVIVALILSLVHELAQSREGGAPLVKVERDTLSGDKVIGGKTTHTTAGDTFTAAGDVHFHKHYGVQEPEDLKPSNLRQIPEPTADFVGREGELDQLLAAFDGAGQGAVISGVRGMAGVGKTELAKVLAKQLKDRFPDAQIYFNLRGASGGDSAQPATAAEALSHIIQSFHPDAKLPEEIDELQGMCHSVLEGKRVLLLMDNAADAAQLAPLSPPPDGCALLVTSRHHFALGAMKAIDLNTLPEKDARELLLEICARIGDDAEVLAQRCGYLPLALRLAASALDSRTTLSVAQYIGDLSEEKDRLAALDEYKDLTAEQLGVQASLAMSYNLLDESQQRFWRALGVFPGSFDSVAADAVCLMADGQDADTVLGDLYAASMVQWDDAKKRFSLHDLLRDYARGQLDSEERTTAEQRHAAHYLEVLRSADNLYLQGGDAVLQGLALFDREWGNIAAGQASAASRRITDGTAAQLCSDYPNASANCLNLRLHPRDWIDWLENALDAARIIKDQSAQGNHLGNLGNAYAALGEIGKVIEFYEQALVISREIGDRLGEGNALGSLGIAYKNLGEPRKAIEYHERALAVSCEIGDRRGEGQDLGNLGIAYANLGDPRKAIGYLEQALAISRGIGDRRGEGAALGNLGNAYAELGELRKAIDFYEQQLEIVREIGDRRGEGAALGNLGIAYANLGDPRKAIDFYEQHLEIVREIGDRGGEGNALGNLGTAYAELGEAQKAIEYYEQRIEIAYEIGDRQGEGSASHNLSGELAKVGRVDDGIAYAEKAVAIFEQIESPHAATARAQLEELRNQKDE